MWCKKWATLEREAALRFTMRKTATTEMGATNHFLRSQGPPFSFKSLWDIWYLCKIILETKFWFLFLLHGMFFFFFLQFFSPVMLSHGGGKRLNISVPLIQFYLLPMLILNGTQCFLLNRGQVSKGMHDAIKNDSKKHDVCK